MFCDVSFNRCNSCSSRVKVTRFFILILLNLFPRSYHISTCKCNTSIVQYNAIQILQVMTMSNKPFTNEQIKRIKLLREKNKTYSEIANEIGVSIDKVSYFCRMNGLGGLANKYRGSLTEEQQEKTRQMREQGATMVAIAEQLEVNV